ncbi:MAG TPA: cytochrome c biogenesis protein CcdA [Acidimicrobiales bacterium]|nr:cytochrome c biogenesis protein CcdA [Acidimicrobiales bacterium]
MSGAAGYLVAFGGGIASFLSPCVLPLVPGYLSVVTGLELAELRQGDRLARIAWQTGLFVAGFSAVFVLLGLSATTLGRALFANHLLLTRVSGGVVLAMAVFMAGSLVLRAPRLYGEARFHPVHARLGPVAAPVAGVAFGFGWTPCVGPVLASVLAAATIQGGAARGALLLAAYSAGLGLPFLATGLAFGRLAGAMAWVRARVRAVTVASVSVMGAFGVLLVMDRLAWVTTELEAGMRVVGLGRLVSLG